LAGPLTYRENSDIRELPAPAPPGELRQCKVALLFRSGRIRLMAFGKIWRFARWILKCLPFLLPIGLIAHAVSFWGHGIIDAEAMEFVLNYLQKRPFVAQIFDPQINDWSSYQARELSYVFDFVDARVFAFLLDRHILVFVPLSGVVGLIAASGIYFWGARKVLGLDASTACLLLSLFLSCIVVQASTPILYRSSKIILSVALLGFLFYLFALLTDNRALTPLRAAALFLLALIMALCDRQGFYYLISTTAIVFILWFVTERLTNDKKRAYLTVTVANAAAIVAAVGYNRILAPTLIHALNGYWPDFSYQNIPWSNLADPALFTKAFHIFRDQVSFFFGNIPFVIVALVTISMTAVLFWKRKSVVGNNWLIIIAVSLVTVIALIVLLATMIARHPAVYDVRDHEFWYYTLTLHVVIVFGISIWIWFADLGKDVRSKAVIYAVSAILIALNFGSYGWQRDAMIHSTGWFDGQYARSQSLLAQFRSDPPRREKLQTRSGDLFLDDPPHFLENVELSYLHLIGAMSQPSLDHP
jgi:hypothetical protein